MADPRQANFPRPGPPPATASMPLQFDVHKIQLDGSGGDGPNSFSHQPHATSSYNFNAAHDAIQRQLSQRKQQQSSSPNHGSHGSMRPHPPPAMDSIAATGRHRHTESGLSVSRQQRLQEQQQQPQTSYQQPYPTSLPQPQLFVPSYPTQYSQPNPSQLTAPAAAAVAPISPGNHESLPYHRKRLLELVDPNAYELVLADTARQLGVDLATQPHKRWVVEALFLAPLPQNVIRCYDEHGHAYYHDKTTQTSSWKHPCAAQFEVLLNSQPDIQPPPQPKAEKAKSNDESHSNNKKQSNDSEEPASESANTRRFLRANAGLSSTSSLFLNEDELAAWSSVADDEGDDSNEDDEIMDEFGGRDGARWSGENGDGLPVIRSPSSRPQTGRSSATRTRPATIRPPSQQRMQSQQRSRPSSSYSLPPSAANKPVVPWSSTQPPTFHPWINPSGVGDTEQIVPSQGSLIAESRSRPASSYARGGGVRPMSGVPIPHSSSRTAHSAAVRANHKVTRQKINGALRDSSSHLYTVRQSLITKYRSLDHIRTTVLNEDERVWLGMLKVLERFIRVTLERQQMHNLAASLLHAEGGAVLHATLVHSLEEGRQSHARIKQYLIGCQDLRSTAIALQTDLQSQIDSTGELLRMDVACLELSKTGVQPLTNDGTSTAPLPSPYSPLPFIQQLLRRIQDFHNAMHQHHSNGLQRKAHEKKLVDYLSKTNCLLLRQGMQHCCERKAKTLVEFLRNKGLIPTLQNQVKSLKLQLQAQMQPLAVCQRTYELRAGRAAIPGQTAVHLTGVPDENLQLLHSLEDELTSLTTLVTHLESELSLTQQQLSSCLEQEQLKKADMSTEDVRIKFYKSMLAVTGDLHAGLSSDPQSSRHHHHAREQEEQAALIAGNTSSAHYHAHAGHHHHSPERSASPSKRHQQQDHPQREDDALAYRKDPHRVGTYLHSFDPSAQAPRTSTSPHHQPHQPQLQQQRQHQEEQKTNYEPVPPPPRPSSGTPYGSALGGSGGGGANVGGAAASRSYQPRRRSLSRPGSAISTATGVSGSFRDVAPSQSRHSSGTFTGEDLRHERAQLIRDQASNQERLRTRKVRRARVNSGAAEKPELLIPNAGRPVFEGIHSTGYDS